MTKRWLARLLLFLGLLGPAAAPAAGAELTGRVVDEAGRPVAGAEVALSGDPLGSEEIPDKPPLRPRTDRAGRFHFDDLPEGDVTLFLQHPSYAPRREVHPVEAGDLGEIVLRRGVTLTGLATDPDGRPVAGLPLRAFLPGMEDDEVPALSISTGSDGTFVLPHVPAGGLRLSVCREDYRPLTMNVQPGDQPVHLTAVPAAVLRGWVLDSIGRPVAGAVVTPHRKTGDPWDLLMGWRPCPPALDVTTDDDGRFSVAPLPPGWYDLEARADGLESVRAHSLRAAAGAAVDGIEIRLQPSAVVAGAKLDAEDAPVAEDSDSTPVAERGRAAGPDGAPGAVVTGRVLGLAGAEPDPFGRVELHAEGAPSLSSVLANDGTFRLRDVPPGTWELSADVAHRKASTTITVQPGQTEVRADLRLPPTHPVSGQVLDDLARPVARAWIVAWDSGLGFASVETGADGRFTLDLPDGTYDLNARHEGFRSESLWGLKVLGTAVTDLELRLVRTATLRGRLLGHPPGETVTLKAEAVRSTGSQGGLVVQREIETYSLPGLAPGLWSIEATSSAGTIRRTIEIPPGVTEMELDLDFTTEEVKP